MATLCTFWLMFFLVLIASSAVHSRPGQFEEFGREPHEDRCKIDDITVIEVCQRCAKQTKSPIVYPMCCVNEDDVYNWCNKYINYGRKAKRRATH